MIDDKILQEARTERSRSVVPRPTRESLRQLCKQREDFLSDPLRTDISSVREVIARSWRRSLACKVDPIALRAELREARIDGPFLRVAMPVVERLENVARDTGATVVLADPSGTIAMMRGDRDVLNWAGSRFALDGAYMTEEVTGTNSDGTALEEGMSVQVWGPEHYSEELQDAFCTSVPIRDPLRRRIAGVLTLMVPEKVALATDPASLSLIVEGAAAEITRTAAVRLAPREQTLLEAYMRESRVRGAEAVLAIDDRTTIASTRAQQILTPEDYAILSGYAREAESGRSPFDQFVALAGGNRLIRVSAKPVLVEGDVVGAVLRLREVNDEEPSASLVSLAKPSPDTTAFAFLVGSGSIITALRAEAAKLLGDGPAVCLTGERGTGRAQIARTLAAGLGGRRAVQEVDCAADNGAVVLLHLDELSDEVCRPVVDLLADRAQDGVVFATAHDVSNIALTTMMAAGAAQLHAPPLRTRKEDIPALAQDMLRNHVNGPLTPSPRLTHALAQAAWPGNLDDLRGVLLASTVTKKPGVLCVDDLCEPQRRSISRGHLSRLEAVELEQIRQALGEAGGNRVRAAEILEIGRSTLYRKIDAYNRRGFDVGP